MLVNYLLISRFAWKMKKNYLIDHHYKTNWNRVRIAWYYRICQIPLIFLQGVSVEWFYQVWFLLDWEDRIDSLMSVCLLWWKKELLDKETWQEYCLWYYVSLGFKFRTLKFSGTVCWADYLILILYLVRWTKIWTGKFNFNVTSLQHFHTQILQDPYKEVFKKQIFSVWTCRLLSNVWFGQLML